MTPYREIVSFRSCVPCVRAGEAKLREGAGRVAAEAGAGELKISSSLLLLLLLLLPLLGHRTQDSLSRSCVPWPRGPDPASRGPGPDPASQDAGLASDL